MAALRSHNFFNLQSMRKLYNQLHNKPEGGLFNTVGEVVKHRDALVRAEEIDMENTWLQKQKRLHFLTLVESGIVESNDYWIETAKSQIEDYDAMFKIRSARREADVRACVTFFHRCGLDF